MRIIKSDQIRFIRHAVKNEIQKYLQKCQNQTEVDVIQTSHMKKKTIISSSRHDFEIIPFALLVFNAK